MGQDNEVPRRIAGVEGSAGQHMVSGGAGAVEEWGDLFYNLRNRGKLIPIPLGDWTEVENNVIVTQTPFYIKLEISDQLAAGDGRAHLVTWGLAEGFAVASRINWDFELFLQFEIQKQTPEATSPALCYFLIKEGNAAGPLITDGLGIRIGTNGGNPHGNDRVLYGVSYGSGGSEEAVALGITMSSLRTYTIGLHHLPGVFDRWYVRGVLSGTQSIAANIPTGVSVSSTFFVASADKAATDPDAITHFFVGNILIWQAHQE